MVRHRLRILMLLLALPFLVVLGRLWSIQVDLDSHINFRSQAQRTMLILDAPRRGQIFDRRGRVLAENQALFDLHFTYRSLNPRSGVIEAVCRILSQTAPFPPPAEVEEHLRLLVDIEALASRSSQQGDELLLLVESIPPRAARSIEAKLAELEHERAMRPFELLPASTYPGEGGPVAGGEGYSDLWVRPDEALQMELTLHRLAERIPKVSYAELLEQVVKNVASVERRLQRDMEHARRAGFTRGQLSKKEIRDRDTYLKRSRPLVSGVSLDVVTALEYYPELFPGIRAVDGSRRRYPLAEAAAALVGHLRPLAEKEVKSLKEAHGLLDHPSITQIRSASAFEVLREGGMSLGDLKGSGGLESFYDSRLRGKYGMRLIRVDNRSRPRKVLESLAPESGKDLKTTLDAVLQERLYELLERSCLPRGLASAGSVAVMELPSGALLASVGVPAVDPNRLRSERGYLEALERRHGKKSGFFLDRPRLEALFPGSVFKVVTALAAHESGREWNGPVSLRRRYRCQHKFPYATVFRCTSRYGHNVGELDLIDALQFSCNTYFYYMGHKHLSPESLHGWAQSLGFGRQTGVDLPPIWYDRGMLLPPEEVKFLWICQFAIGQRFVKATPLQILRAVAAFGVGCKFLPRPYLVQPAEPEPLPEVKSTTVAAIVEGMRRAASDPRGTAGRPEFGLGRYRVAVKTSTAQYRTEGDRYHAWLAGFAPVPDPKIAFVVVLERTPEHGGEACSPVVRSLLAYFAREDPDFLVHPDGAGERGEAPDAR